MPDAGVCAVCSSAAEQKCSNCQSVHYCSREHQKQHWKSHKHTCAPVRVNVDPKLGRYVEAAKTIKVGDIILKEVPLITGPAQVTPAVCLGCYKLLEQLKTVQCELCGWPFCSEECTTLDVHKPECHYTQQRGDKVTITNYGDPHPNYQCITVLRCLYQRDHNQILWEKLQALESQCEARRRTPKWQSDKKMIADFICNFFKLGKLFSEDEIMKCCGIIQMNGHEVPLVEPEYICIFETISVVEHNCKANSNKSFTSNGSMLLCAAVDIAPGSHVTACATDPMLGTESRRHQLAESKFLECSCERCSDVTEYNTMFSAVKCKKKDCSGYLLPETFLVPILGITQCGDKKSPNDNRFWNCSVCEDAVSDGIIQRMLQDIARELTVTTQEGPDACERLISHCAGYLHPNHYYLADVSLALAQMIGQDGLRTLSDDRLLLKAQLCRKYADLLETLAPAETRLRGSLLFELHAAIAESGHRKSSNEGAVVFFGHLTESRKILMEAISLLRHEPPELPEGQILRQARVNLMQIDELISALSKEIPLSI
ncbi:SET domain-containing protein SmydA-8 [Leptidea sinapis]|uniref:SET domain-containing protein SmydA-8 n=1 Tax=Leptidea sinapis TaxID=189913 RepID=UPI00213B9A87|nr:SET domain-containing protein SmydA-8 [Leptidea sinapis]